MTHTVVVGAGIAGLAAAHELRRHGAKVTVIEAANRAGGKIDGGPLADSALPFEVDMAADGFLAREPEMIDLVTELGLGDELVPTVGAGAAIWVDGALRRVPPSVLGAPFDADAVAASGIVTAAGAAEFTAALAIEHPAFTGDATVGEVVRPRVGDQVFERLVDPLIGGINAGEADKMSIRAGAAALAAAAEKGGSFESALRSHVATAAATADGSVFRAVRGGTRRVIDALVANLGDDLRLDTAALGLEPDGAAWRITTDNLANNKDIIHADRVIITSPGWISAGLIAARAPEAAAVLAGLSYADAVLVTFVAERAAIEHPLDLAGFLVPRDQGLLTTATSFASSKWAHYDDGTHAVLRVSAGRTDDRRWLELEPAELVERLTVELRATLGLRAEPVARVTPWRQCLPQYRPGHLDRCDDIDAWLARDMPGVHLAGASMRGLGLPACVRQGRAAAKRALGPANT